MDQNVDTPEVSINLIWLKVGFCELPEHTNGEWLLSAN